jgi:hypothetical protein
MNDMTTAQGLSQVAPEHGEALERLVTYFVVEICSMLRLLGDPATSSSLDRTNPRP